MWVFIAKLRRWPERQLVDHLLSVFSLLAGFACLGAIVAGALGAFAALFIGIAFIAVTEDPTAATLSDPIEQADPRQNVRKAGNDGGFVSTATPYSLASGERIQGLESVDAITSTDEGFASSRSRSSASHENWSSRFVTHHK